MSNESKSTLVGRVWRDPDCASELLAEQHRMPDGRVVVHWKIDPETLRAPVWLEVLDEDLGDPSVS